MAPPRKPKNEEALMAFAPVKRRHPPREEIERGNVRYSMLNMMATGNPLVPKFAPWGSSRKASSSEPIIEVIDMRSQRDKTIKRLTETWAESTGDPTLPDMMVERLKVLRMGQDQEFTVTQDGKKSHSVKMTRRFQNGEDLVQILVSMNRGDAASSDTQTKPEKAKKEIKGSSGKSSAAASSDKEDEADAGESTAPAEVEDAKQKGQGKKAKGKGKAAAPEADAEAAPEAAPEASAAAPAASGAHGEWTQAQDESILSLKGANETWVSIAKQVGRGKNEVQKRYKELSAAKNEPPKEEPATNSNGNAKPSPAKSPNKPQEGTNRSPGGPAPGFPPPALSGNPHVMDARHPAYFGYPPPADVYHSGYAPFPPGGYHYLPPRPEYYHPHYPPGPFNPYYPPAIVNNNNYYPMHGPGAYMGTRSDNHFPTEDAHDWLLSEGAAVKYMNKGGKRIVLIRCYSGDRIRINNHLLEEPPNGWRNDKHSSSRPLRYELTSIHARVRSGSSVWVMGSEIDTPGGGWGNESEGCKIYTHRDGGSQGSITSPKGSGFGSNGNNGENQNSGSPALGAEQANNGSQNGEVAANPWDNNANTSAQEWDNNANTTAEEPAWDNSGNDNADNTAEEPAWNNSGNDDTQNTFDADKNNEVPTTEWDNTNNNNAGGFANLGTATEQMNLENIAAGFNSIVGDADNNNGSGHPGSPTKNSDTAAPADDWPSNLPRSFMDAFTIDFTKGTPEDQLLLSPNTRAQGGVYKSSTKGKGKQPSTGKGGGKQGGSRIASDTGTHVPGEWSSSPNVEAENEGGNNDAGATSWGDDNNATAGASNWETGNTTDGANNWDAGNATAGASTWDDGNGASGAQASTWDNTNTNGADAGDSQW